MATISKAELSLRQDVSTQTAFIKATCEVKFTDYEMELMHRRPDLVYFQLSCKLLGKDLDRIAFIDNVIHDRTNITTPCH